MKKVINSVALGLVLSLSLAAVAQAEMVDARAVGLGGTTLGLTDNGAFSPLRNPASMVNIGWGAFILPLSPSINFGNNVNNFSAFIPPQGGNDEAQQNYIRDLLTGFSQTSGRARVETVAVAPLLGFSGAPFPDLQVMGKPVAFGINLWGKGAASGNFTFSEGFSDLLVGGPTLLNATNTLADLTDDFSAFTSITLPDLSKFNDVNNQQAINEAIQEADNFHQNTLKPLISQAETTVGGFERLSTDLDSFLTNIDSLAKEQQRLNGDVVADGHGVIALSGASNIFSNDMMNVSVGVNLKGFFFPSNPQMVNPVNQVLITNQNAKLFPLTLKADVDLGPFNSLTDLKQAMDNQIKPILTDAKEVVAVAKELDTQLDTTIPKAKVNALNAMGDLPAISSSATKLQTEVTQIASKASELNQVGTNVRSNLAKDLESVKINLSQVEEVAPMGVGVDLGFQANIMNDLTVGLMLENPLVLWPAKVRSNTATIDTSQLTGSGGNTVNFASLLKLGEDETIENTNYTMSEPFALRLGGGYKLDSVAPALAGTTILADIEQVFNGRPLAVHLGVEKGWMFDGGGLFGRLGTQLGGVGNLFTIGLGGKVGPFVLDFGYGASNPFNPVGSRNAVAALSTSLVF